MSLIAKRTEGAGFEPLSEGIHTGVCTWLIDLGNVYSEKYENTSHKIMLMWDIVGETVTINGEELPRTINREYKMSLHEKAMLYKDLCAWRGRAFTPEELQGFNVANVLGAPCQIQVIHETKNERTYARIGAIMAMAKGMPKPDKDAYPTHIFDFDDKDTWETFWRLPEWIQSKIREAQNFDTAADGALADYVNSADFADVDDEEGLPF